MISIITAFLLLLFLGSLFCLGFYTITRGKIITMPDGTEVEEKEIFGSWQLFWEHELKPKKIFYSGEQLVQKLRELEQVNSNYIGAISFATEKRSFIFEKEPQDEIIRDIESILNVRVLRKEEVCFLYNEYPVYKFPQWVRKITNCYVCYAGWGGTFIYWLFNYKFHFFHPAIIFWVIYCVSLAFANKLINKIFDNNQN